jgi:catechol 2,3-dioxygenase-like lactoylglutathione lyase family enzyme
MEIGELVPLLNVEDLDRSIAFYTKVLRFQVVREFQAAGRTVWAMLRQGGVKLMVHRPDDPGSARRRARPSYGETVLYLFVDSARDWHAALTAEGIEAGDVAVMPYGMEEFQMRDPDGYEIAIGSPLTQVA